VRRTVPAPLALLVILAALRVCIGWRAAGNPLLLSPGDVGQWLDSGDRILRGQLPFRDFIGMFGPLLYLGSGWVYGLLGANWHSALLQFELLSPLASLALAYASVRLALHRDSSRILALAAAFALGMDHWRGGFMFRIWAPLVLVLAGGKALRDGDRRAFALACAGAGLWLLVSIETAAAALAALAALAAAGAAAEPRRRWSWAAAFGAAGAAPALSLLLWPGTGTYFSVARGLAKYQNYIGGQVLPELSSLGFVAALALAPFAVAAAGLGLSAARWNRSKQRPARLEAAALGALALFAALSLRSLLGRFDPYHLMFAFPPTLLLLLKLLERLPERRAAAVALLALAPYAAASVRAGELQYVTEVLTESTLELADWPEEGVRARPYIAARMRKIAQAVEQAVPPGKPVLSLPLGIYAHLARRPSASPFLYMDYLPADEQGVRRLLAASAGADFAVIDPRLSYPAAELERARGQSRRLTWFSEGDEAIARPLRSYLDSHFEAAGQIADASLLRRRPAPVPEPQEDVVASLPGPSQVRPEQEYSFELPAKPFDELRVTVRCRYRWGLSSLAKTKLELSYMDSAGAEHRGILSVPPAELGLELRVPVERSPLRGLKLRVQSPGAFNPAPSDVELEPIRLVTFTAGS
jgi:hypothetical protein